MTCFIGGGEGQEPLLHLHFSDPSVQEIQYAKKSFWDQHDLKPITFLGTPERRQDGGLHQDRLKWVHGGVFHGLVSATYREPEAGAMLTHIRCPGSYSIIDTQ